MAEQKAREPGDLVMSTQGEVGRYVGDDLCLVVIGGGLQVGKVDESAGDPGRLSHVHDLEVLAATVMFQHLRGGRA